MGFTIAATIQNKNSTISPDQINLASFCVRIGDEVFLHKFDAGKFEQIRGTFRGMQAKSDKQNTKDKKPMTFSWYVLSEKKTVFPKFKDKTLIIRVTIVNQDNKHEWVLTFEDVKLSDPKPDYKDFPGYKRTDERFDATFINFIDAP